MKIYEVTNDYANELFEVRKGVELRKQADGVQDKLIVALANDAAIDLHRTEPHVDRLTRMIDRRLYSAHPVYKLKSGALELASDVLRDDMTRVIVVIRGSNPKPIALSELVGDHGERVMESEYARNAIGAAVLIAASSPDEVEDTTRDSVWIVGTGQGIELNNTFTLAYDSAELKVHRSVEWLSAKHSDAHYSDEIWI